MLSPLLALQGRKLHGCELDVHLRVGDEVHVYCGLTRPISVRYRPTGIGVTAAESYAKQACARPLFGHWRHDRAEAPAFAQALSTYLDGVKVASRWTDGEGRVQSDWSQVVEPWIPPFDRLEATAALFQDKIDFTRRCLCALLALEQAGLTIECRWMRYFR